MTSAVLYPGAFGDLNLPFLCAIVATVFVGAFSDVRSAAVGGLVLVGTVEYLNSRFPDSSSGDYVFLVIVFSAAWLVGRALATRARQTHRLELQVRDAGRTQAGIADRAAAEERERIAGELHDVVAHGVSVMVVQASGVRRLLTPEQQRESVGLSFRSNRSAGRRSMRCDACSASCARATNSRPPCSLPNRGSTISTG